MALRTMCIHLPRRKEHGFRISTMSRHTKDDGVTVDMGITPSTYNDWWKEIAPLEQLVFLFRVKKLIEWEEFERIYRRQLRESAAAQNRLRQLIEMARKRTVTIMCVEETPEHCHRRIIAELCREIAPDLKIIIE